MKPCSGDIRHKVLITGDELRELKRHVNSMVEAFGLDRKIEAYKGTRPLTLYRWDLECLMDVIEVELADAKDYPNKNAPEYQALKRLGDRLRQVRGDASMDLKKLLGDVPWITKEVTSIQLSSPSTVF